MRWTNALIRSVIWVGIAAFYAYMRKSSASILDVRTDAPGWMGAVLLAAGIALHCWSNLVLAVHDPVRGQPATLALTGPFRLVRNPIYLAGILVLTGIGLLYGPVQVVDLVVPVTLFAYFHLAVIFVEEPGLRTQFGATYGAYCRRVPRWLPRFVPSAKAVKQDTSDGTGR